MRRSDRGGGGQLSVWYNLIVLSDTNDMFDQYNYAKLTSYRHRF